MHKQLALPLLTFSALTNDHLITLFSKHPQFFTIPMGSHPYTTCLHLFAAQGNIDAVERLHQAGANYHIKVKKGFFKDFTPLQFAQLHKQRAVTRYLTQVSGKESNKIVTQPRTPSHPLTQMALYHHGLLPDEKPPTPSSGSTDLMPASKKEDMRTQLHDDIQETLCLKKTHLSRPLNTFCDAIITALLHGKTPCVSYQYDLDNTYNVNSSTAPHFTIPSADHLYNNQDRIETLTTPDGDIVTILCDGITNCNPPLGTINGRQAAIHITTSLKQWCHTITFQNLLRSLKTGITKGKLEVLRAAIDIKVQDLATTIDPPESATTLEFTLEVTANQQRYLLAMSYGDSETLVVTKSGLLQLNPLMTKGYPHDKRVIFGRDHLVKRQPYIKAFQNPGGMVSKNWTTSPTLTYVTLEPGTRYMVFSDGIGDAYSIQGKNPTGKPGSKLDPIFLKTVLDFSKYADLSLKQTAQLIATIAAKISPKRDDIVVSVRDAQRPNYTPDIPHDDNVPDDDNAPHDDNTPPPNQRQPMAVTLGIITALFLISKGMRSRHFRCR